MNISRELREASSQFIKATEIDQWVEMKCSLETSWGQSFLLKYHGAFLCITKSSFSTPWEMVELDSQVTPWIEESDFEQFLVITGKNGNKYRVKLYALEKDSLDNFLKSFEDSSDHRHVSPSIREDELRVLSDFESHVQGIEKGSKPQDGVGFIDPVYGSSSKSVVLNNDDRQGAVRGVVENKDNSELEKIARKVESKVINTVKKFTSEKDGSSISPYEDDPQLSKESDLSWHGKSHIESLRTLADLSISKGEYAKALNYLKEILVKLPHERSTVSSILKVLENMQDYSEMSSFLRESALATSIGQTRDYYCDQGVILARSKLNDESLAQEFLKLKDGL
ncbi:hypothetical protein KKF34_18875 [Myxococcota bacterium]|nr:hypothetical protein [Myxococcota bacterium]MBU1380817.1 hypothetical protein [Myxococcota bacterium]MBU1498951.1 hypothetical protein [Myxococcota bacterium]